MTTDEFRRNKENFCYRHPDRQSFVLCQRCMRTICPECQTQAPVGVICPECLRDQQNAQTPAQQKAQRRWSRPRAVTRSDSRPIVTYTIIGITGFFYLLALIPGVGAVISEALAFKAWMLYPQLFGTFQPWRLFTVTLVHEGFWHVGLNMLALWMIGRSLEPLLGRGRFVTLYGLSALGGSVAVALLAFTTPVVGASGAIYGLFGALLIIGRHVGANMTAIVVVLGVNLVLTFLPLLTGRGPAISWQAHLGGLAVGALVGFIITRTQSPRQRWIQVWLLAAVAVALLLLLIVPTLIYF